MSSNRQQQEQLQETNEASMSQMEQQMRQSPGSVSQQQIDNKARLQLPAGLLTSDTSVPGSCASSCALQMADT